MWGVPDHLELFTGSVGSMLISDFMALGLCSTVVAFSLSKGLQRQQIHLRPSSWALCPCSEHYPGNR